MKIMHFLARIKFKLARSLARFWLIYLKGTLFAEPLTMSSQKLDVVIPLIKKDLPTFPKVVESIRHNVKHPIGKIIVVAPQCEDIQNACKHLGCEYCLEDEVLPFHKSEIDLKVNGQDRSSWLYQQFLKLEIGKFVEEENYLIVDADTLFVRPQRFDFNGKTILNCSDEFNTPYFITYERLFMRKPSFPMSFVSHHMVMNKGIVAEMKDELELRHQSSWWKAIIDNMFKEHISGFAEYETYGHYMLQKHREKVELRYWFNIGLPRSRLLDLRELEGQYAKSYKTVSFHAYLAE